MYHPGPRVALNFDQMMSALPPKADISWLQLNGRFVPIAHATGANLHRLRTTLFNQQQPALPVAVEGIYGVEQSLTLDQPWLVVLIDVKDEH